MYFVRKKDLVITGGVAPHIVQFQLEDYFEFNRITLYKQLQDKEW